MRTVLRIAFDSLKADAALVSNLTVRFGPHACGEAP
jgi:hypothetical protein